VPKLRSTLLAEQTFDELAEIHAQNMSADIQFAEAYAWHHALLARRGEYYDPFVRERIELGKGIARRRLHQDRAAAFGSYQELRPCHANVRRARHTNSAYRGAPYR
jgi:hypothetical protein